MHEGSRTSETSSAGAPPQPASGRPSSGRGPTIEIAGRPIGAGEPVYVIAELSANHNQSLDAALALVRAAADAGADAIKIQTYTADTMTLDSDREEFQIRSGSIWDGATLHSLYRQAYTPWEWQPRLKQAAADLGLPLFSTPFDGSSVEFLERMGVPAFKIASFELVDLPLIRRVAAGGKPMIMSTGMARLDEIHEAVEAARSAGCRELALLKCTSAYPAPAEEANLRTIPDLADRFAVPVGLSDHTLGIAVPVAAVALGASLIEKHLTLSRADGGPDAAFSLEPEEFAEMVRAARTAGRALGAVSYEPSPKEAASRAFRRSLFAVEDIRKGEAFTARNVRAIRPGHGLPPRHLDDVLAARAAVDIARGTPLAWELIAR